MLVFALSFRCFDFLGGLDWGEGGQIILCSARGLLPDLLVCWFRLHGMKRLMFGRPIARFVLLLRVPSLARLCFRRVG